MNLHDRMTPAEAHRLERELRLVCAHCRRPATRETSALGRPAVRHANDFLGPICHHRRDGKPPEWVWTAPTIGGYRLEGP